MKRLIIEADEHLQEAIGALYAILTECSDDDVSEDVYDLIDDVHADLYENAQRLQSALELLTS